MAADAFTVGMDGMSILEDKDGFRASVKAKVAEIALQRIEERNQRLADMIAIAVLKRIK